MANSLTRLRDACRELGFTVIPDVAGIPPCETCQHRLRPDGGWCYMFREMPQSATCAQYRGAPTVSGKS